MYRINRLTVVYDPDEDRIALNCEDAQSQLCRLWLTRRLADRLVAMLLPELGGPRPPVKSPLVKHKGIAPAEHASQVYAQLQSRLAKRPTAPVTTSPQTPPTLIREITLSRGKSRQWRLTLQSAERAPVELTLAEIELRQWLEALHRNYRKAAWDTQVWPDWFRAASRA